VGADDVLGEVVGAGTPDGDELGAGQAIPGGPERALLAVPGRAVLGLQDPDLGLQPLGREVGERCAHPVQEGADGVRTPVAKNTVRSTSVTALHLRCDFGRAPITRCSTRWVTSAVANVSSRWPTPKTKAAVTRSGPGR
jgi:hypothetical protein